MLQDLLQQLILIIYLWGCATATGIGARWATNAALEIYPYDPSEKVFSAPKVVGIILITIIIGLFSWVSVGINIGRTPHK